MYHYIYFVIKGTGPFDNKPVWRIGFVNEGFSGNFKHLILKIVASDSNYKVDPGIVDHYIYSDYSSFQPLITVKYYKTYEELISEHFIDVL